MKRLWNFAASVRLAVWLLFVSAFMLLVNSLLASRDFSAYAQLNVTPVWQWLAAAAENTPAEAAAIMLLFTALAALAMNTAFCTFRRLRALSAGPRNFSTPAAAFRAWAPTVMHILFALILTGHMLTFTLGRWEMYHARENSTVTLKHHAYPVRIAGVRNVAYRADGPLGRLSKKRLVQVFYRGKEHEISELRPLKLGIGDRLILMLARKKKSGKVRKPKSVDCSGDELSFASQKPDRNIVLKRVWDPGVAAVFAGFALILVMMLVFYAIKWPLFKKKNRCKDSQA